MKKILSLILIMLMLLSFTACKEKNTAKYTAIYDYGTYDNGKAALLLEGTVPYFDFKDYGIDTVLAGDIIDVTYKGEMVVLESYPSTVIKKDIKITDVKITPAEIIKFEIVKPIDEDDKKVDLVANDDNFNFYILRGDIVNVVNKDFTFKPYTELTEGTKVYATYQNTDDGPYICGLYSYKPR